MSTAAGTIWTIGHSNRPWDAFEALLRAHGARTLVDVRAFPGSRRWPHFSRDAMARHLDACGIEYHWLPALGGRRPSVRSDSPHRAWTVTAFRNYADHLATEEFRTGLARLVDLARARATAVMCAEALVAQCHRRLISDRLTSLDWRVLHITGTGPPAEHCYPPFLRIVDGELLYDIAEPGAVELELPFPRDAPTTRALPRLNPHPRGSTASKDRG
jgi:uncharacterized protein (DUF488 family)